MAKNDNFKAQVLSSLDTSISELPSKVTAVENRLATMNNQLFDDEQKPVFVKKPELDTLITVDLIDSKLPTTVCKTKDCLTATIGDHYTTNSTVVSKIDTAKAELNSAITAAKGEAIDGAVAQAGTVFLKSSDLANNATIVTLNNKFKDYTTTADMNSAITAAKGEAIDGAVAQAGTVFLKSSDLANNATIVTLNNKFKDYTTTADLNNTVGGLAVIKALPTSDAVNSAIDAAKTTVINDAAGKYATTAALNNVDGKFQNYTTTANLGNVEVIKTMQGNIAANTTKITTNTNKFSNYTTTDTMNSAIADAKTYADGKAEAAKTAAIAQAATDSNTAITTAKTEINNTINTVKNAVIGIAGNAAVKFDNVSAPDCTSSGCSIKSEYKPGGAM